jgi:GBP family porin
MNKFLFAGALIASGATSAVQAQSALKIYGVIDTAVEHLSASDGTSATLMMKTAHVPSRIGFSGTEDLGDGLRAGFVLEAPFFADAGSSPPDGRLFGRQALVSIGSARYGDLKFGRQFSFMQTALAAYDPDHFSPYSPALAMQLANTDQTSMDNMVSYWSPELAGFSLAIAATLAENAALTPNVVNPQVVGAGTARNGTSAMLQYKSGGLGGVLAYQGGGENLATGGAAVQKMFTAGVNYRFDAFELGSILWTHRNRLPNDTVPKVTVLALGGAWRIVPAVRLNIEFGRARDNGLVYATGAAKAEGTNNYYNLGASYDFSRKTTAYVRAGRITDEHSGFNGRQVAISPAGREGVPVPVNGSVNGMALGLRTIF